MPASQSKVPWRPPVPAGVSMRDLLASCAAAAVISRPPAEPEPERMEPVRRHRDAA
ncbi:hypothetical protein ACFY0F_25565 [Streptomyces sp. NPDC001544]|uniref:hypothetical protein n=1 Tax=Streptomyces sp. NPDC001544 TaxID=3364584 RepID=UPI00368C5697